ncbi:MAG: hypothetical protein AAF149_09370 [Bacteroidota bacterium]
MIDRRNFITTTVLGAGGLAISCASKQSPPKAIETAEKPRKKKNRYDDTDLPKFLLRRLTEGPNHHFFGYYGVSPWNREESVMVGMESTFQDRLPNPGERAAVGLIDPVTGKFEEISQTLAWNLQQGAMLHWNPLAPNDEIIYNDRVDDVMASVKLNVRTGQKDVLPRPISGVSKKGKYALSLTYGRLSRMRKVVGYADAVDPFENDPHPKEDGVFSIDLETNETKLITSIDAVYEMAIGGYPALGGRHIWFNHTDINPSGTRFLFLARSRNEANKIDSAMFTVNIDGSDLKMVVPFGTEVSHFGWRNDQEIVATLKDEEGSYQHYLFTDGQSDLKVIGKDFIIDNGHCTFSANGRYLTTDRTQDESKSTSLWLYDMELDKGMLLANLPVSEYKYLHSNTRCDFHPRWSPAGNKICFDAIDPATHTRQMHLVEFFDT